MPVEKLLKRNIAKQQLETAILIFLNNSMNFSSIITLCGATGNILDQYVKRSLGKESFIDYLRRIEKEASGKFSKRKATEHKMNTALGINAHKHYSPSDEDYIEADLENLAFWAIIRCTSDYMLVFDEINPIVERFYKWSYINKGGVEMITKYKAVAEEPKLMNRHSRFQLCENQLKTAIALLATEKDFISVVTLAGAADTVLNNLLIKAEKNNFIQNLLDKQNAKEGTSKPLHEFGNEINNMLYINHFKHFDDNDSEEIEVDLIESAVAVVSKAIANVSLLKGKNHSLVKAFHAWIHLNNQNPKYSDLFNFIET